METKELLEYAQFLATKFGSSRDGWIYSRDTGDLKHIRYGRDYTGYNHWTKRLRRAFDWKHLTGHDRFSRLRGKQSFKQQLLSAQAWISVSLRKDANMPDGQINGILTHWEEDGEYIQLFQPRVGVKVLDFLRAEPENPHALAIVAEMKEMLRLSEAAETASEESPEEITDNRARGL